MIADTHFDIKLYQVRSIMVMIANTHFRIKLYQVRSLMVMIADTHFDIRLYQVRSLLVMLANIHFDIRQSIKYLKKMLLKNEHAILSFVYRTNPKGHGTLDSAWHIN